MVPNQFVLGGIKRGRTVYVKGFRLLGGKYSFITFVSKIAP